MNKKREWTIIQNMLVGDFNENHDPENGQFTSGSGGGSSESKASSGIKDFNPPASSKTEFEIKAMGGKGKVKGYVDNQNNIGYQQLGNGSWTAYNLKTGRSIASGEASFTKAKASAAKAISAASGGSNGILKAKK